MKRRIMTLKKNSLWLVLLLSIDLFFSLLLWLADIKVFHVLIVAILLGTMILFGALCSILTYKDKKREEAFEALLNNPDQYAEESLLRVSHDADKQMIHQLAEQLRDRQEEYQQLLVRVSEYEDYVEAWAHEVKTPISLLTMILDNRREDMPDNVGAKLDHVRNRMQESVNHMLFYSRLKGTQKDYMFESIDLQECVNEILEDYRPLLEENEFMVSVNVGDASVFSDRRGLNFLLSQLVSNAVKYSNGKEAELEIKFKTEEQYAVLSLTDNGNGVRESDLPYIFEKGFTGDSGESRKKATGMGLYLAKEMAADLNIRLEAESEWKKGFEMRLKFPIV